LVLFQLALELFLFFSFLRQLALPFFELKIGFRQGLAFL